MVYQIDLSGGTIVVTGGNRGIGEFRGSEWSGPLAA